MAFELTAKLYKIFETKQVTERFSKREFVAELEGRYPQRVLFQLTGENCGQLDDCQEGEPVRIEFDLRGREWSSPQGEVKYFNSLDVRRLQRLAAGKQAAPPAQESADEMPEGYEDLPF